MSKLACVALLIAISLQAQNAPAPSENAPQRESASPPQAQPPAGGIVERELPAEEVRRILLGLGYDFDSSQVKIGALPPTLCAIPLMPVPLPDKNFAMKNKPANPSIDPKIALTPTVPACSQTVAPLIVKPLEPAAEKK
jgi:hypothetical protein